MTARQKQHPAKALRSRTALAGAFALAAWAWSSVQAAPLPAAPTVRLISQSQYISTIKYLFGPDIAVKVRFAPVKRDDGLLAVGASSAVLTSGGLDPLESTGRAIADQVIDPAHRPFLVPCKPQNAAARDDACARAFFSKIGRRLYRRPLTEDELAETVDIAGGSVGKSGDFYGGLAYALSGMLVSPEFLFVRETTEPDPSAPGTYRLDAYSKASRLSFLLWNSAPDEQLLTAAERGDLHQPAGLRRQVDRMIASPLYRDGVRAFFTDFFVLESFDTLAKDTATYPAMTLKALGEAREQLLRTVVDHLVTRHGDYRDLYTTRRTFISSDLGVLYRLPINTGSQGWVPYEFPPGDARSGIITQIGFLVQYSQPSRSSPTRRGRAIREVLLCQKVPDPPPNVDFTKFEAPSNPLPTARARLDKHREDPVCAGCHRLMDPLGVALENFDGAGQYRPTERDAPIDASGTLDGVTWADAAGLGKMLRDQPALKSCIVNRLYAYSTGHKITPEQKPLLAGYQAVMDKKGYRFDDMLRLVVLDQSFFSVRPPPVAAPVNTASN
jgi:hypothetical protein